jgi:hypothetical protein
MIVLERSTRILWHCIALLVRIRNDCIGVAWYDIATVLVEFLR